MTIRIVPDSTCDLPAGQLPMVDITPAIGAHIGPNAVGFARVSEAR